MKSDTTRCMWVNMANPVYVEYHDSEWGVPTHSDALLFELLLLEAFQPGLSWECVLNKRQSFRRAFDGFNPEVISTYDDAKISELMSDSGIIRNRLKINAAIKNSRVFLDIQREFGSFDSYIWGFTGGAVVYEPCDKYTTSPLSDRISKDLRKRGMSFVGSTVVYSYLQAVGIINGHTCECFLSKA